MYAYLLTYLHIYIHINTYIRILGKANPVCFGENRESRLSDRSIIAQSTVRTAGTSSVSWSWSESRRLRRPFLSGSASSHTRVRYYVHPFIQSIIKYFIYKHTYIHPNTHTYMYTYIRIFSDSHTYTY